MPLYFQYMAGNIVDVSTLASTFLELEQSGVKTAFALIDAGYYSQNNIQQLYEYHISFLTRLPVGRNLYKDLITEQSQDLEIPEHAVIFGKRVLYVKKVSVDLFGNAGFAYVVCDIKRKVDETTKFLIEAKENRLSVEDIQKAMPFKGKFVLISSSDIPADEVLALYYTRRSAENMVGISKDFLDLVPLRIHSIESFRGYLMLNFLSLVAYIELKKALKGKYTVEGALAELTNLMCKVYDKKAIIQEPTKKMKEIFFMLGIMVPNLLGV